MTNTCGYRTRDRAAGDDDGEPRLGCLEPAEVILYHDYGATVEVCHWHRQVILDSGGWSE